MNIRHDSIIGKIVASVSGIKPIKTKRDPELTRWIDEHLKPLDGKTETPHLKEAGAHGN